MLSPDNYNSQAGDINTHYFNQDIIVASQIHENNPETHIDVGSRIDGFVAHVATFREIKVYDIRPLENIYIPNIKFIKQDIMSSEVPEAITDSLSSLHVLEHFGLGRYGDPVDPNGHIKGFNNLLKMLKVDGLLYVSFPIATANLVQFNAHRIFHPLNIFNWAYDRDSLELVRFDYIGESGNVYYNVDLFNEYQNLDIVFNGCGIYTLKKVR